MKEKDLFSFIDEEDETVKEILENEDEWNKIDWNKIPMEPNEKKRNSNIIRKKNII